MVKRVLGRGLSGDADRWIVRAGGAVIADFRYPRTVDLDEGDNQVLAGEVRVAQRTIAQLVDPSAPAATVYTWDNAASAEWTAGAVGGEAVRLPTKDEYLR